MYRGNIVNAKATVLSPVFGCDYCTNVKRFRCPLLRFAPVLQVICCCVQEKKSETHVLADAVIVGDFLKVINNLTLQLLT